MKKHFSLPRRLLSAIVIFLLCIPAQLNCRPAITSVPFLADGSVPEDNINGLFPFNPAFISANHIRKIIASGKTRYGFPVSHVFSFDKNGHTLQCISSDEKEIIQGVFYEYDKGVLSTKVSVSYGMMTVNRFFYDSKGYLKTAVHFKIANNNNFQVFIRATDDDERLLNTITTILSRSEQQQKPARNVPVFPLENHLPIIIDDAWYAGQLSGSGLDLNVEFSTFSYSRGDTNICRIAGTSYYRENGITTSDMGTSYIERYTGKQLLSRTCIPDNGDTGATLRLFEYKNGRPSAWYDTHVKEQDPAANAAKKLLLEYNPEGLLSGFILYRHGRKTDAATLVYTDSGLPEKISMQSEDREWQSFEQKFNYEYY